ncbi:MAG: hypothetical protein WC788_02475 [Candidatus Paceibacterota bacterium]|jgi:hypothetical protein
MKIDKKAVSLVAVSFWILFSVVYVAIDIWDDFKKEQLSAALQSGYQQGKTDMINAAISQAKNEKCDPFSIYNDKEQVQLISVSCLKQDPAPADGATK